MKILKMIIMVVLIVQIADIKNLFAGQYQDAAIAAVADQKITIQNYVQNIVLSDMVSLEGQIVVGTRALSDQLKQLPDLEKFIKQYTLNFEAIASLNSKDLVSLRNAIQQEISQYDELNRQYFAMTFMPTTIAISKNNFLSQLDNVIKSYSYMCEKGRNDLKFQYDIPSNIPPDPVAFEVYLSSSPGNPTNPKETSSYQQLNYQNNAFAKVAKVDGSILPYAGMAYIYRTAIANTAKQVAVSLGATTGSTASAAATAMASGIFFAAGVILAVAAIASYLDGVSEYNEMMQDYYLGEVYKIQNGASSRDISAMYTQKCKNIMQIFAQMSQKLHGIQQKESSASGSYLLPDPKKMEEQLTELTGQYNNQSIAVINAARKKDADPKNIQQMRDAAQAIMDKVVSVGLNYATDIVVNFIENDYNKLIANYDSNVFAPLIQSRQRALEKLVVLINIQQSVPNQVLNKELAVNRDFLSLKKEFYETLADTFEYIFGRKSKQEVQGRFNAYLANFDQFYFPYLHLPEVFQLKEATDYLKKFLEEK